MGKSINKVILVGRLGRDPGRDFELHHDEHSSYRWQPREHRQHPGPAPSAQAIPRQVSAKRRAHREDNDHAQAQVPVPCQRAGAEQSGDHRYGEAALIAENPRKQKPLSVLQNHGDLSQ